MGGPLLRQAIAEQRRCAAGIGPWAPRLRAATTPKEPGRDVAAQRQKSDVGSSTDCRNNPGSPGVAIPGVSPFTLPPKPPAPPHAPPPPPPVRVAAANDSCPVAPGDPPTTDTKPALIAGASRCTIP